jgi:hypothetical protein
LSEAKRVISDQISAIRKQEKAYAEGTESAEFAEKSGEREGGIRVRRRCDISS